MWSIRKEMGFFVVDTSELMTFLRMFSAPFRSLCTLCPRKLTRRGHLRSKEKVSVKNFTPPIEVARFVVLFITHQLVR